MKTKIQLLSVMSKTRFALAICIQLFLFCITQRLMAQNPNEFSTPEKMGYTLTKTTTLDGLKCDHYEKDGVELRTLKKQNGDFITIKEDPDGFNKAPDPNDYNGGESIGSYRITYDDGITLSKVGDTVSATLKNNNRLVMKSAEISYQLFKEPGNFYDNMDFFWGITNEVYLAKQPEIPYPCSNGVITINNKKYKSNSKGDFLLYTINVPLEGTDKTIDMYACELDSIIKVNADCTEVYYANGDKVVIKQEASGYISRPIELYLQEGTVIHRKNGLLRIKNGKQNFTMNDGTIFTGWFKEQEINGSMEMTMYAWVLQFEELTPYYGTIQYPDGTIEKLSFGESERLLKEKREKEQKEGYEKLCKLFGKNMLTMWQKAI